jgi:hypothetical protein
VTAPCCAVTALAFSPERGTLTWGDDVGRMAIWDLNNMIEVLQQTRRKKRAGPPPPTGRAGEAEAAGGGAADEAAGGGLGSLGPWLVAQLQGRDVKMQHVWQAHSDSVSSLHAIAEPPAVFSCSADRLATVWSHDGETCFGTLRRRRRPDVEEDSWSFPVDGVAESHRERMLERAAAINHQRLHSEAFRSRQRALSTPMPSEAPEDEGPPHSLDTEWRYAPAARAELCAEAWHRSRVARKGGAPKADDAGATFLTAPEGGAEAELEEAGGAAEAAAEAAAGEEAAEAAGAEAAAKDTGAGESDGAEALGAGAAVEVGQATDAVEAADAAAGAAEPAAAELGNGEEGAGASTAPLSPGKSRLYNPPARTFAEGARAGSVAAARLDNALSGV